MAQPRSPLTRRGLLAAGLAALAAPALARGAPAVAVLKGDAFATGWRVTLPAGRDPEIHRAALAAVLAEVDAVMSPWRADSAISAFNAAPAGARAVPPALAALTSTALAVARTSRGWFDPTVGPLVGRWGFGPIAGDPTPRWEGLAAGPDEIAKDRDGLTFDPCGIAKGHALDRLVALLQQRGERAFLIDLGGELAARGVHPSGRAWKVAVEDARPGQPPGAAAAVIALDGEAVASSGIRRQGYDLGDRRVSHIIDPRRRAPCEGGLEQVSVLAADATAADGWATALMAAGATEGPALARGAGLDALFVFSDARQVMTGRFARRIV